MPQNPNDDFRGIRSRISLKQVLAHYRCADPLSLIAIIERITVQEAAERAQSLININQENDGKRNGLLSHQKQGANHKSSGSSLIYDLRLVKKEDGTFHWKDD